MKAALLAIGIPVFALLFGSVLLFAKKKKHMVVLAGSRRGMSGDCRPYSYLRSTWSVCLDALGAQIQRWPLPRFLECCPRSYFVSRRVFVSRFDEAINAAHHHPVISNCTTTKFY